MAFSIAAVIGAVTGIASAFVSPQVAMLPSVTAAGQVAPDATAVAMATLDATPLFATLPRPLKQYMAESAEIAFNSRGENVVEQGADADSCFIVRRGLLSVHISNGASEMQVALLRDGDLFGEMSLLTGEPRWATVRAEEESEVVRMHASALRKALIHSPELVHVLAETVALRQDELQRARALLDRGGIGIPDLPEAIRNFLMRT